MQALPNEFWQLSNIQLQSWLSEDEKWFWILWLCTIELSNVAHIQYLFLPFRSQWSGNLVIIGQEKIVKVREFEFLICCMNHEFMSQIISRNVIKVLMEFAYFPPKYWKKGQYNRYKDIYFQSNRLRGVFKLFLSNNNV